MNGAMWLIGSWLLVNLLVALAFVRRERRVARDE